MPKRGRYPEAVQGGLVELRTKLNRKISISVIRGRYCLYEYKYLDDKETGGRAKKQFYIGWLDINGRFNPAMHRKDYTKASTIEEYMDSRYFRSNPQYALSHPSKMDRDILKELSMNARITMPELAKKLGISSGSAAYRTNKLIRLYKIEKTLEIYPERFGFARFIITAKFYGKMPDSKGLKGLLESEPRVQLAALMRGDHDLLIYIIVENTTLLEQIIYKIRSDRVFSGCSSVWNIGYLRETYGYAPLRDAFFKLLESRVWTRSRDSPRRGRDQLLVREYATLKEMNSDSGIEFINIDEKHGLNRGSAQYTFHHLVERGLIEKATIKMRDLPIRYSMYMHMRQMDVVAFGGSRTAYFASIVEDADTPTNRYALVGDVSAPYGIAFLMPVFEYSTDQVSLLNSAIRGVEIESSIITEYIVGTPGFRKFDNSQSPQAKILKDLTHT